MLLKVMLRHHSGYHFYWCQVRWRCQVRWLSRLPRSHGSRVLAQDSLLQSALLNIAQHYLLKWDNCSRARQWNSKPQRDTCWASRKYAKKSREGTVFREFPCWWQGHAKGSLGTYRNISNSLDISLGGIRNLQSNRFWIPPHPVDSLRDLTQGT